MNSRCCEQRLGIKAISAKLDLMLKCIEQMTILFLIALVSSPFSFAQNPKQTLRLCSIDQAFYPFVMPDGSGLFQQQVKKVAGEFSEKVDITYTPWARCLTELKNSEIDATIGAFTPERLAYAVYPMKQNQIDPSRAMGLIRFNFYRLKGSTADWDGKKFSGLKEKKVAVQFGFAYHHKLKDLGIEIEDSSRSTEQLFDKLKAGRLPLILALESDAERYLHEHPSDKVEAVKIPFEEDPLYFMTTKKFFTEHKALVEKVWDSKK